MKMLTLRLQGPLMAFGDTAVDELRPTDTLPSLSQITGLLANALGWNFGDRHKLQRLQDRLLVAFREDTPGRTLRDFQTARLNSKDKLWRTDGSVGERTGGSSGDSTVMKHRDYRVESSVTALVSLTPAEESPTLEELAQALQYPARPLFVGRVCCPPSAPICWEEGGRVIIDAPCFEEAFSRIARRCTPGRKARSDNSRDQKVTAEWPLSAENEKDIKGDSNVHLIERCDSRRWLEGTHGGRRFVWRQKVWLPSTAFSESAGTGGEL